MKRDRRNISGKGLSALIDIQNPEYIIPVIITVLASQ
jgi:hypothetical protein